MPITQTASFHRRVLFDSQYSGVRYWYMFPTGSCAEIENCNEGRQEIGLETENLDADYMTYETFRYAFPHGRAVPDTFGG